MKKRILTLGLLMFSCLCSCGDNGGSTDAKSYSVNFELNKPSEITTTSISNTEIKSGELISKPVVIVTSSNINNYHIESWHEDSGCSASTIWDFDVYRVDKNLTLYAKWSKMYSVNFYMQDEYASPLYVSYVKPGNCANTCDDQIVGHKVDGYYEDKNFTKEFDFEKSIETNTDIYIKSSKLIYFNAETLNKNFSPFSSSVVTGATKGNMSLINTKDGQEDVQAVKVNFGYSPGIAGHSDPYIAITNGNIDARHSQIINIKMKNLGNSKQLGFYWVGLDKNGEYICKSEFNAECSMYYDFTSSQMNMNQDDDFFTVSLELSKSNAYWTNTYTVKQIRIESNYASTSSSDLSNEFIIKEITSVNIPEYDVSNPQISVYEGSNLISSFGVKKGNKTSESYIKGFALGKKVTGIYSDFECTTPFDFDEPIVSNTRVYITCSNDKLFFSPEAIAANFTVEASGNYTSEPYSPVKGTVSYNNNQKAADVDFGISPSRDPQLRVVNTYLDVEGITKIKIGVKNLGKCDTLDMFWCGYLKDGSYVTDEGGYGLGHFESSQTSMTEDDEFTEVTINFDSAPKLKNFKTLTLFRIDASYICSPDQYKIQPNRMLISYIKGE